MQTFMQTNQLCALKAVKAESSATIQIGLTSECKSKLPLLLGMVSVWSKTVNLLLVVIY